MERRLKTAARVPLAARPVYGFAVESFGRGLEMTLLQAAMIVVAVGFALAAISSFVAWNSAAGAKPPLTTLLVPFALKWVLYSGGVALALGIQYLLLAMRA
jgi:hypothetical protein